MVWVILLMILSIFGAVLFPIAVCGRRDLVRKARAGFAGSSVVVGVATAAIVYGVVLQSTGAPTLSFYDETFYDACNCAWPVGVRCLDLTNTTANITAGAWQLVLVNPPNMLLVNPTCESIERVTVECRTACSLSQVRLGVIVDTAWGVLCLALVMCGLSVWDYYYSATERHSASVSARVDNVPM